MTESKTPLPLNRILIGDVRTRLAELPDASVDCIITSPPYFALRDYGHPDQIGAEATVEDWANEIAAVCEQLHRVLTQTGALWLNLGDGYSRHPKEGAAKKSLLLAPHRVALKMGRSGWLLRNQIIWAKPNPLPNSVTDRFTNTHEVIYFFTRQRNYFFDLNAVREPAKVSAAKPRRRNTRTYLSPEAVPTFGGGTSPRVDLNGGLARMKTSGLSSHPLGRNPGDAWTIPTGNYRGAHFATFPIGLVRRPLLSTCPERVCVSCDVPWRQTNQMRDGRKLAIGPLKAACTCRAAWRPGRVLDPFMGAGTVALAAETYGRDWIGMELNPAYAELAYERLAAWRAKQDAPAS